MKKLFGAGILFFPAAAGLQVLTIGDDVVALPLRHLSAQIKNSEKMIFPKDSQGDIAVSA